MNPSSDLVNKLWRLCALLRKDGVTYQQYVTELTYLLFLKMASEQKDESRIPAQYRWGALKSASETEVLGRYRQALVELGDATKIADRSVVAIFQNASTIVREPANLRKLIDAIDGLHWFSDERDAFGDAYEGLLQKMAEETKRGAGQYFTPRVLIDVMVRLMRPQPGEVIQDPAAGTGGFLIAADRLMREAHDDYFELAPRQQAFQLREAFRALENVPDTYRLLLMNLHLHKIDSDHILLADTLSPRGSEPAFKGADLFLTNPPFGPAGGPPTRDDLTITDRVSSYQLPFVEHCIRALKPGGRAAVVVPDNVLFDDGRGKALRQRLMNWCDLHTILRLPTGIFYAQGVKTNVLFFTRAEEEAPATDATDAVWIYDMRAGAPAYGKTNPLKPADFADFVAAFGDDPHGRAPRSDTGETGRFRRFTRDALRARGGNLDISWLKDTSADAEDGLDTPEEIAAAIEEHLASALQEVRALLEELGGEDEPALAEAAEVMLPKGWVEEELGYLTSKIGSGATPRGGRESYGTAGTPLIRSMNVHFAGFRTEGLAFINEEQARLLDNVKVEFDDVLFNITGASIGRVCLAPAEYAGARVNQHVCILRAFEGVLPRYIERFLATPKMQSFILEENYGLTRQALTKEMVESIKLPLPPLAEQRLIVAKLDALTTRLARARAELERIPVMAARLRQSVLKQVFAQHFAGDPRHQHAATSWTVEPLREIISDGPTNGWSPPSGPDATGPLTLKLTATTSGHFRSDSSATKRIYELVPASSKFWLNPGDLLVQRANSIEYVGASAIFDGPERTFIYPDLMMRIRIDDPYTSTSSLVLLEC